MLQPAKAKRLAQVHASSVDDGSPLFDFAHYGRIRNVDQLIEDLAKRAESAKGISSVKTNQAQRDLNDLLLYVRDAAGSRMRSYETRKRRLIQRGRKAFVTTWAARGEWRVVATQDT